MEFTISKKIYYHDTDSGGVVYYANYLKFFEEARTEFFRAKGIGLNKLMAEKVLFCVASVDIKYKSPAKYADDLIILTKIEKLGNVYIDFFNEIKRSDILICQCITRLVCIDENFRPQAIPQKIADLISL